MIHATPPRPIIPGQNPRNGSALGNRVTHLTLNGPIASIDLRIRTRLSTRQRRQIALTFFRQLEPWLRYFRSYAIHHPDTTFGFIRTESRGIELRTARDLHSPVGRYAFRLRMRRLDRRWTQAELAKQCQMSRTQLSRIERGLHRPSRRIFAKLEYALRSGVPSPIQSTELSPDLASAHKCHICPRRGESSAVQGRQGR